MTNDLSKWRTAARVAVPFLEWDDQEVVVYKADTDGGILVGFRDNGLSIHNRLSLDDAENFATLILYEVKRAKGEL